MLLPVAEAAVTYSQKLPGLQQGYTLARARNEMLGAIDIE